MERDLSRDSNPLVLREVFVLRSFGRSEVPSIGRWDRHAQQAAHRSRSGKGRLHSSAESPEKCGVLP